MKICITTPIFPPEIGGPATYTYEIAKRLSGRGHKIKVVTFLDSDKRKIEGVEIFTVKTRRNPLLRQGILFARILCALKGMDLLFAQDPVVVGVSSFVASKVLKKPMIVKFVGSITWETTFRLGKTLNSLEEFLKSPDGGIYANILLKLEKLVLSNVKQIVTPSRYLKDVLVKHYGVNPRKIAIIPNTVDLESKESPPKMRYGDPTIVTVGRLVPWKGIQEILETIPLLVGKYPKLSFLIAGDGPEKDNLKKVVKQLGVQSHVLFLGRLPHVEVISVLKGSDIFILNSIYEGLPHTVIEAMGYGVPVIATNIKGNTELIENNVNGLLIDVGNKEQLVNAVIFLLENDRVRRKIVKEAFRKVESYFTWEKTSSSFEEVLRKVLRKIEKTDGFTVKKAEQRFTNRRADFFDDVHDRKTRSYGAFRLEKIIYWRFLG